MDPRIPTRRLYDIGEIPGVEAPLPSDRIHHVLAWCLIILGAGAIGALALGTLSILARFLL